MHIAFSKLGLKRWILGLAIVAISTLILLSVMTWPYGYRLVREGFPAYQWPAQGHYALVKGQSGMRALPKDLHPLNHWSSSMFDERQGRALMVLHMGRIKLAHYGPDVGPETRFNSFSMVKSLIGLLVLKAHGDGLIAALDDPVGKYLPDFSIRAIRERPVSSFLAMRSGLDFEIDRIRVLEGSDPKMKRSANYGPSSDMTQLHMLGLDAVARDLRLEADLATDGNGQASFRYQNINSAILGAILEQVYGVTLPEVLSELLWRPSGAQDAYWRRYDENKPVSAYCCLYATATDWLRIGHFINANGTAERPLLPQRLWNLYIGRSVDPELRQSNHYGSHVYHNVLDRTGEPLQGPFTYFMGNGGQMLYLMPEHGLVVVRFGEELPLLHSTLYAAWRSITEPNE